jgi:hypothetical protein
VSSYDLFVGRHGGNEPGTDGASRIGADTTVFDHWEALAAQITDRSIGHFVRFDDDDTIDLCESATGIVVSLGVGYAFVSAPYWHIGPPAREVLARTYALADLVAAETGLRVYDPQLRREVLAADLPDEALARYAGATAHRPAISVAWIAHAHRGHAGSRRSA